MSITAMCFGGPLHGRVYATPKDQHTLEVDVAPDLHPYEPWPSHPNTIVRHLYHPEPFLGRTIWVSNSTNPEVLEEIASLKTILTAWEGA